MERIRLPEQVIVPLTYEGTRLEETGEGVMFLCKTCMGKKLSNPESGCSRNRSPCTATQLALTLTDMRQNYGPKQTLRVSATPA